MSVTRARGLVFRPAQLKRSGTLPDDDDNVATKGSVVHLRAADASPNGTRDVYVRITGEEAKNSFVLHIEHKVSKQRPLIEVSSMGKSKLNKIMKKFQFSCITDFN